MSDNDVKLKLSDLDKKQKKDVWHVKKEKGQGRSGQGADVRLNINDTQPTRAAKRANNLRRTLLKGEFKQFKKTTIIWFVIILGVMLMTIALFPLVQNMGDMFAGLIDMASLPPELVAALGAEMDIVTYFISGSELKLCVALFAGVIAAMLFTKDKKGNAEEFLYSTPLKRSVIVWTKFELMIILTVLMNIAVAIISLGLIAAFAGKSVVFYDMFFIHIAECLLLSIITGMLIFGLSLLSKKRIGLGLTIGIILIFYFITVVCLLASEVDFLKYFSPLAIGLYSGLKFPWVISVIWLAVSLFIFVFGFLKFKKQDLV